MKNIIYIFTLLFLALPVCADAIDSNTLHYYDFNDGTAADLAGSYDLAVFEGASITDGKLSTYNGGSSSTGYFCANSTDYTTLTYLSNFIGSDGSFSFEAMVKPLMAPGTAGYQEIICCESDGGASDRGFQFRIEGSGTSLRFQSLSDKIQAWDATISYVADQWYHAAVTYNAATGSLKIYWTPAGDTPVSVLSNTVSAPLLSGSERVRFCIGNELRAYSGYGNENFEGEIDDVRISNIARQPSDMSTGSGSKSPDIILAPSDIEANEGGSAILSSVFESETDPIAQWYKVSTPSDILLPDQYSQLTFDADTNQYTSILTIDDIQMSDAGQYYCRISNESDSFKNTDIANLTVYGLFAHWTLDQASFQGGYYLDQISSLDAAVTGTPTFVTGADGIASSAVLITPDSGWALSPMTNPVNPAGEMTVSFWANSSDTNPANQDLVAQSYEGSQLTVTQGIAPDTLWQHVCLVFDGTDCTLYLDGIMRDKSPWPSLASSKAAAINIGIDTNQQNTFNGAMDDMRLYNYALSDTQVADLRYTLSGQRSCLLLADKAYDISGPDGQPDCYIDLYDFQSFAAQWLTGYDLSDFAVLSSQWLDEGLYPQLAN